MLLHSADLHTCPNAYSKMLICENECKSTALLVDCHKNHQYWLDWCWQMEACFHRGCIPLPLKPQALCWTGVGQALYHQAK